MWRPLPTALRTSKHFCSIVVVVFAIGIPQAKTAVQYRYVRDSQHDISIEGNAEKY